MRLVWMTFSRYTGLAFGASAKEHEKSREEMRYDIQIDWPNVLRYTEYNTEMIQTFACKDDGSQLRESKLREDRAQEMQKQSQEKKGWGRIAIIGLTLFLAFLLLGTALLALVFSIPARAIAPNAERSLEQIAQTAAALKAKGSDLTFAEWLVYYVDFSTEQVMISSALAENDGYNALQSAMDVNGYARYWHGYLIFVRPLLLLTDYRGLVTLNVTAFLLLFGFCAYRVIKRCNGWTAIALLLSLIIVRVVSLVFCLSFSVSFFLAMLLMIAVSYLAGRRRERLLLPLFLASGICIAYFEQLMTPLVALGLPLLLYLAI